MCPQRMLVGVAVLAAACGGSPSAPTAPALSSGSYHLVVHLPTGTQTCDGQFCTSLTICSGSVRAGAATRIAVSLIRDGDEAMVRHNDSRSTLVMTLRISDSSVAGTAVGRAFDTAGTPVDVIGVDGLSASLIGGFARSNSTVLGVLTGHVSIGGASCSGDQSTWGLERAP